MHVISTAGHVDHGKSTLVKRLTGTDPDRLAEEQARGMTIDLGFAHLLLPSGRQVGIVDVPGHERFVHNMLAGVGGVDLVLFVVAANEGWMPQSREHLAILDLLGVSRGILVLTKRDLVEDDMLNLALEEARSELVGTSLAGVPAASVSAATGAGIEQFLALLDQQLALAPIRPDRGRPRLWVDRVFSVKGAGTVVTGTLEGGRLELEQELEVLPGGASARVRGLQSYNRPVASASPGSRVAVNLSGVDREELRRGGLLALPGQRRASAIIGATVRLLLTAPYAYWHRAQLKLHIGSAELDVFLVLLDRNELAPGETALAQLELDRPLAVDFGDRFVLRDATIGATIGGGAVLEPLGRRRRRRDTMRVLERRLKAGGPVPAALTEHGLAERSELPLLATCSPSEVEAALAALGAQVVRLGDLVVLATGWEALQAQVAALLEDFHRREPLLGGMARQALRSELNLEPRAFDEVLSGLERAGVAVADGAIVRRPGHSALLDAAERARADRLLALLRSRAPAVPTVAELPQEFSLKLLNALAAQGELVRVSPELFYPQDLYQSMVAQVVACLSERGAASASELRAALGTTRKYAIPFLEYLDQVGVTRRVGDQRTLAQVPS